MKKALAAAAVALFLPASAQAGTITASTTDGQTCTVETITEPTRFGLTVAPCVAKRAAGVAFLHDDDGAGETFYTTQASNGRLPYSNIGTAPEGNNPVPGLPELPGIPGLPELPGIPGLPELPGLPGLPELPELPGVTGEGVVGERVTINFALFLKEQRHRLDKNKVKWRKQAGGDACKRHGPTILACRQLVATK